MLNDNLQFALTGKLRKLALSNARKTYLADEELLRNVTQYSSTTIFQKKMRYMRTVIRKDILGKNYRRCLGKYATAEQSEENKEHLKQEGVDYIYEEENTNTENDLGNSTEDSFISDFGSEVTIGEGAGNIVIHTDKEIVGEPVEVKDDVSTLVKNTTEDAIRNVPFYFLKTRPGKSKRSWEPELGSLVTHDKFMYLLHRINRDSSVRWFCKMDAAPFHCRGKATTYKDNHGKLNYVKHYSLARYFIEIEKKRLLTFDN